MKQGTTNLIKFKKLQRRLGLSKVRDTIGILESLWALARREAPRGDIGRLDNEAIAIELEWDEDPDQLVAALVETSWLDECDEHRLVVHDWKDHAPRYVLGIAAKKGGIIQSTTVVDDYSPRLESATEDGFVEDTDSPTPSLAKSSLVKPSQETSYEVCPTADEAPAEEPISEPVTKFVFPVKVSAPWPYQTWTLTESLLADYRRRFPHLVVEDVVQKALDWVNDSPVRKKSGGGMKKFLTSWLKSERGSRGSGGQPVRPTAPTDDDLANYSPGA